MLKIFLILAIFFTNLSLYANLRAPKFFWRNPSYALNKTIDLKVNHEKLIFNCPSFEQPAKEELFGALAPACIVTAIYEINSIRSKKFEFSFIAPSSKGFVIHVNDVQIEIAKPKEFLVSIQDRSLYRFLENCDSCNLKSSLYQIDFSSNLLSGNNVVKVQYKQNVSYFESSHSYTSSKWSNEITYELWPLKEWTLDKNFSIEVLFKVKKDKSFFSNEPLLKCNGKSLNYKVYPFSFTQKIYKKEFVGDWNQADTPDPFFDLSKITNLKKDESNNYLEIVFDKNFPDRLVCSYGER
ncbi:MAG: hypothetical protein SFU98_22800 [Leptospiraceae bacterium]|nr:hypothetical protein [Leptospiraceae bacterium]